MFTNKENPEYYAERIFYMISVLKKYCMDYDDIYEIETIIPVIEYLFTMSDKLYCHYLDIND